MQCEMQIPIRFSFVSLASSQLHDNYHHRLYLCFRLSFLWCAFICYTQTTKSLKIPLRKNSHLPSIFSELAYLCVYTTTNSSLSISIFIVNFLVFLVIKCAYNLLRTFFVVGFFCSNNLYKISISVIN
jgi:hypothetical protein